MNDVIGQSLGRYRVAERIGEGGMGVVYRAHDTRLDRDVAIKVLAGAQVSNPKGIERFKREARAVARLSHPNILEIHDFGEDDSLSYAVMELLDGSDLRRKLQDGSIPVRKAVKIAQQAANGLGAAHSAGVIHRDIKPENLFLTRDGRLKILDFGLAHLKDPVDTPFSHSGTTESLTEKGTVLGTPRYMSPEQIRGQKIGAASDIFSLGCVIYEMISGTHPFQRETGADTLSAILSEEPEPLATKIPDLPVAVDELVLRCLEKEADDRLESARDLGYALEAISEQRAVSGRTLRKPPLWTRRGFRIAIASAATAVVLLLGGQVVYHRFASPPILPYELHVGVPMFQAIGEDEELRQLAAGLSSSIVDGLEALEPEVAGRLWVVPQSMATSHNATDCLDLHRVFNATVCVEGQLSKTGDQLTLEIEAVDPTSGKTLGSKVVEDDWGNLAVFQSAPVRETAALLNLDLQSALSQLLDRSATNVTPALVAYLRGSGLLLGVSNEAATRNAIALLEQATQLDPLHGSAWSRLASGYQRLFEETDVQDWLERGREAVAESLDRSPTARALMVLASLRESTGDPAGRVEALEEAVALEPRCAQAFHDLGLSLQAARRPEEAERALQRAINLRPGYWPYHNVLANFYLKSADYNAAANQWRQVTRLAPDHALGYANLGIAYWYLDDEQAAIQAFERSIDLQPEDNYFVYSNLGTLYFGQARYADAVAMYEKALAEDDRDHTVWGNLGFAHTQAADPSLAVEPLRKAITLAELKLSGEAEDLVLLTDLASYHATLGEEQPSLDYLARAVLLNPTDPADMVNIGEAYLDIGHREEAIAWIRQAMFAGMPEERLMARPELRELMDEVRLEPAERPTSDPT